MLAAADERYAAELAARPAQLARASGVALSENELHMLEAVAPRTLGQSAAGLRAIMEEADRRQFMRRSAAALGALLAGSFAATGAGCNEKERTAASVPVPAPVTPPPASPPAAAGRGGLPQEARHAGRAIGIGDMGIRPGTTVTGVGTGRWVKERVPKAMVKQSRPQIDGTMNASTTYRTLKSGMRCVRGRYQRALKRDPGLSGKVSVCLTINTQGRVTTIDVDQDTIGDSILTGQIKACLKRLRFSPPEGGSAKVCVPFSLQSKK